MRRIFIVIAVLVLALAAGVRWLAGPGGVLESLRVRIVDEASRALGREVSLERVGIDPLRGVVLSGVRIAHPPALGLGPFFTSPRVAVTVNPLRLVRDLARGRGFIASITRIELERPFLALVRDGRGQWSYADLVARQRGVTTAAAPLRATVDVREGSLTLVDGLRLPPDGGGRPPAPFTAQFDRITGVLDFGRVPRLAVALDAVNTDGRTPALLRVTGTTTLGEGTFDLDVRARGGSIDHWGPYILRLPWLAWDGGTFDGSLHLLATRWGRRVVLDYRGTLMLRDGRARLIPQNTRLSEITGPLVVDNLGLTTEGMTLAIDASPVWVRGTVTHHAGVHLDLALRSESLDLRTLQALLFPRARLQLAGRAGGEARIIGPFGSPRLEGEIFHATGSINRQPFRGASGRFSYYGGLLMFDDVAAQSAGGRLRAHARLNLGAGSFFVLADAQGIDTRLLPALALNTNSTLRGRASGTVAVAGRPGSLLAQGRLLMGSGQVLGVGVDRLETLFGYDTGRVEVDRLEARSGPTRVHASGQVSRSGAVDLSLIATDVNLRTIADRLGLRQWLAGTMDFIGRVAGSLRAPELVGTVHGRSGRLGPFPFDDARGGVRLTTTGLQTPGLVLHDGRGRYAASGGIRWANPARIDLTARVADVSAQRLLDLAQVPVRLSGTVSSTVRLSGPLDRPEAKGEAELRDGIIEGQPVDRAEALFRWTGSQLVLDRFSARTNSSLVEARGTVSRQGRIGITFSATDLDLRDVAAVHTNAVRATGRVSLTGSLTGTVRSPTLTAAVASSDLVLNGQRFTQAEGAVRYRRGRLQLAPLTLSQDGGLFSLSGDVVLRDDPILDLQIASRDGELATLLGLAQVRTPFALRGTIDGALAASGPLSNLRATLDFNLSDGRLGDHIIRQASIGATLDGHAITLRSFQVLPEQGELVGAGRLDLRGQSEVEFGGTGLSLDLLRPVFGIRRTLDGTLDFTLQLSGELNDPVVGLSFSTTDGTIGDASFDRLVVQAFYRNGQLNIEHGLLQEDRHKVRLTGTLPFNPARLRFDEARPMNLRLELADSDLGVLGLITDRVERAEGPLSGDVVITGTVARPHMEGALAVTDGTIMLRSIEPALTAVNAEVTVSGDVVRVNRLNARLGDGSVALTGTVGIRSFRPDRLALQLVADGARLDYAQMLTGIADANLRIAGTAARPEVGGTVSLSHGDLFVSSVQRAQGNGNGRGGLNPVLDVEVTAGDALWVNVGGLRLQVHGTVRTTGTWRQPRLAGELVADRGTFVAFNNTFTLTEGRATFAEFRGTSPSIDAWAETRIRDVRPPVGATGGRGETIRVILHITGPPDKLNLALGSDPPRTRDEIMAGLARQIGVTRLLGGATVEDVLRAELSGALFSPFGQAVARTLGLEEFTIEYDFVQPLTLRIGKLLIKDLYITLTSEFGVPRRTVWALEWRLTPTTMLSFSLDNFGRTDVLYRITYRF